MAHPKKNYHSKKDSDKGQNEAYGGDNLNSPKQIRTSK
jgi:hypothetical protein